jgi:hypothetical protein
MSDDWGDFSDSEKQQKLIQELAEIVEELGWIIGIPTNGETDEKVNGLIIGTEDFVMDVVNSTGIEVEAIEMVDEADSVKTSKKVVH